MVHYVRPQIYATVPIKEVRRQLSRGVIPAPFVRRMRVINIISAITLRKIEPNFILPFDVQDLHHILDAQISQDAIILIIDNRALAAALYTGNLRPLWEESRNNPLLRRGFDQSWIARFMLAPFDPICMMLAMRAKLLLDAIDELGHSYNLLRTLGLGWIDFGEIPGEEPDDPGTYVPPDVDQPIDYPDTVPPPGPDDPGYIPGPGDPGYIPPADLTPGDPGYTTTPESPGYIPIPGDPGYILPSDLMPGDPGYIPPADLTPGDPGYTTTPDSPGYIPPNGGVGGASGIPDSPLPPITLGTGPGSPLSGGGPGTSRPSGGVSCCLSIEDPEDYVEIGYFTDHIDPGEALGLTVENAHEDCGGENYTWLITSGGGELSDLTGLEVIYTAPATGHGCPGNTIISLYCGGEVVDTLNITIDYDYSIEYDYEESDAEIVREDSSLVYVVANNTPLTWSVSGTGFSLEHEETDGVGNVLHADETACGSAIIIVTGCDEQVATGSVRCTTGQWSAAVNGCVISGDATWVPSPYSYYELIKGKYKQQQKLSLWYGLGNSGEESCSDFDCTTAGSPDCVECLNWKCDDLRAGSYECGNWCCGLAGCGPYDPETGIGWDGGWCVKNLYLRYYEWIC